MAAANPDSRPMIDNALEYLSLGYPVFPVCSPLMGAHQHRIAGQMRDCPADKRGKTPMTSWKLYQVELPTADDVRAWWRRWPTANVGMATGALAGVGDVLARKTAIDNRNSSTPRSPVECSNVVPDWSIV